MISESFRWSTAVASVWRRGRANQQEQGGRAKEQEQEQEEEEEDDDDDEIEEEGGGGGGGGFPKGPRVPADRVGSCVTH